MSLIMKTCLISLVGVAFLLASNESENLFVEGLAYSNNGQDSLACESYKRACGLDTESVILKELYGNALLKVGNPDGYDLLKMVAKMSSESGNWEKAFPLYKSIFAYTGDLNDGHMLALSLYMVGLENRDLNKMKRADRLWDLVVDRALSMDDLKTAVYIYSCRIEAVKKAVSKFKQTKTPGMGSAIFSSTPVI